jgi:hypothetical protein
VGRVAHSPDRGNHGAARRRDGPLRGRPKKAAEVGDILDRYGEAVELDLAFPTHYRLRDFFDGTEVPNTLANLISAFSRIETSFLAEAIALDTELYDATKDRKQPRRTSPSLIGETREVSILKGMHELLQQIAFYGTQRPGRPKVVRMPRPKTAADFAAHRKAYETHLEIEASLKFVPRDEFKRVVAEQGR